MELYEAYDTEGDGVCQLKSSKKFHLASIRKYCRMEDRSGADTGCRPRAKQQSAWCGYDS